MDARLKQVVDAYLSAIQCSVAKLEASGIPAPQSLGDWLQRDFPQLGKLNDGTEYFKHGHGIAVRLANGLVDFDFGPEGETDQIDLYKMIAFAEKRTGFEYQDSQELKGDFEQAVQAGELIHLDANNYRLSIS